jgi:hypothetical protein
LLSDPDNAAAMGRYVLPDEITIPGDEQRAKVKTILNRLAKGKPLSAPNPKQLPNGPPMPPIAIPSIQPEIGVDDPDTCAKLAKKWLLKNWEQAETNPNGYANILAYLKISAQLASEAQASAALTVHQAAGTGTSGPPNSQPAAV